jgi:glucose uptake protein GlcU
MWAGVLWAAGNVCSIVAVLKLGQAVGYSSVQASIMVSGLWGLFYYKEVPREHIGFWVLSAMSATMGMVLLSQQI